MADVYLAVQQGPAGSGFAKLAVVKKLRENLAEDPDFVAMLMDEARITARLAHPNVVQLFEFGQEQDTYFLAIEYLEGQPLHRIGRRAKKERVDVEPELYYAIVSDLLAGLHHAHELADYDGTPLAVVHRDVTPHNIFVTYNGTVKVVDFGIAKAMGRATETKQGIVKGKVPYMSPEQVSGGTVDRRTDIFAAGVILWNSATGSKLWADLDEIGIVRALCSGRYDASPRAICPGVPEEIDAICRKALAFRPEDRYATAADMRADLEAFLGRGGAAARKKLETVMKELFAPERTKLKSVLEAARLTTTVSPNAFAAATSTGRSSDPRPIELDSEPPPPPDRTRVMPGAPPRPEPSIAAMALPNSSARGGANVTVRPRAPEPAPSRQPLFLTIGAALLAGLALAGAFVFVRSGRGDGPNGPNGEEELDPRRAAAVAPEITPFDRSARLKVRRAGDEPVDSTPATPSAARSAAPRRGPEPAVEPSRPTAPSAAPTSGKQPKRRLDETDPYD